MRALHIIMPLAGEGSRFKEAGYTVPKPLIKVEGKELYRRAMDSLDFSDCPNLNIKRTFIVRKEFNIDEEIKRYYPEANIVTIEKTTCGALETLMQAKYLIDDDDCVVSMDCDIQFECKGFIDGLRRCQYDYFNKIPAVISFQSNNPIYSYVSDDRVCVVEKNPISSNALGGCYYLGTGKNLKLAAEQYINDFENGKIKSKELYLSLVINYIINVASVQYISVYKMNPMTDHYWSFGTPYDLEHYNYNRNIWDD